MNKFTGTWEWKAGDSSFTTVLTKAARITNDDFDVLNGQYRYARQGNTVAGVL